MARELREDVEEMVIQALGNKERRNIIDIVASSGDGVLYSDILHELGVNTGKLNYHLKLLEGIIEKDDSRRYRLTDLGMRAVGLLKGMMEDLDEESVRRLNSAKRRSDEFVEGVVGWYINMIIAGLFTFLLGLVFMITTMIRTGLDPLLGYGVMGGSSLVFILLSWWLIGVKRRTPERIVGFLQRMGLYRYRR
jgi:hypothetical protein